MTKSILFMFLVLALMLLPVSFIRADGGDGKDSKSKNGETKFIRDYKLAKKEFDNKTGKIIDFYLDFHLGLGSTAPNISSMSGTGEYRTSSKLGYTSGVLFYLNILDKFSFTSGLTFDGKSFGITTPAFVPPSVDTNLIKLNSTSYVTVNYLEIPVNFNVGGMVSEKIGLWFTGGPYLGFLLSSPRNSVTGLGYKNFDLGLNGRLTVNYVVAYPISIILGTSFKYGGLNNLGSTSMVDKITTTNYSVFTGLRLAL